MYLEYNTHGETILEKNQKCDGPEKENLQAQYSFFLHGFISAMAASQVISPDANLGFDDDTLKGKYSQHFNLKYMSKES